MDNKDGDEHHILKEKPLLLTEKGVEEFLKYSRVINYSADTLLHGYEIFHINSEGVTRKISINEKEYWDVLESLKDIE